MFPRHHPPLHFLIIKILFSVTLFYYSYHHFFNYYHNLIHLTFFSNPIDHCFIIPQLMCVFSLLNRLCQCLKYIFSCYLLIVHGYLSLVYIHIFYYMCMLSVFILSLLFPFFNFCHLTTFLYPCLSLNNLH